MSSGKVISIEVSIIEKEKEKPKAMFIFSDLTGFYKYKEEKKLNEFKTVYFASIAHDLRAPINTILSLNSLMGTASKPQLKELTEVSTSSCKFLLATIEDVFDLSKIELNQFYLNFQWFQMR